MADSGESLPRDQIAVADELSEGIAVLEIDEKEAESKQNENQSDNEDKTEDNEISMAVKIKNRAPSSIDPDYEDLINKYGNEEYLSKIDIISDEAAEDEEVRSFHSVDGERPYIVSKVDKEDEGGVLDAINSANQEEHETPQDSKVGIEFWRGYGCNIYFQPMTCHTLPLKKIKSKKGNSQVIRFQKRLAQKKRINSSKMSYRMDVPAVKEALSDVGTLKLDDGDYISNNRSNNNNNETTRRVRVGNFVMSKDLQKKVCKGFVCRNFHKFSGEFLSTKNQTPLTDKGDGDNVKVKKVKGFARPSRRAQRAAKYIEQEEHNDGESTHRGEGKHRGVISASIDSTEIDLQSLPKLDSKPRYPESRPYKKTVAGKTLHLTNSLRTIKRVDLLPFKGSYVEKSAKEIKEIALERPLNTTPIQNEEQDQRNESPDEKLVTDHLQEIQKHVKNGLVGGKDGNTEEKYAYESALAYYKNKMDKDIDAVLSTTSLLSKQNDSKRTQNKISAKGPGAKLATKNENLSKKTPIEEVYIIGKSSLPSDFNSSFDEDAFSSKRSSAKKTESSALKLPGLQNIWRDQEDLNTATKSDDERRFVDPLDFDTPPENVKAVRFDFGGNATWSLDSLDDYETSLVLDTASAKLLDRYEVPATKECRLPIIGQKIQTNSSS